jgi:hypothetical protein
MLAFAVLALLALSACSSGADVAPPVTASTVASGADSTVATIQPSGGNCREFTAPITVGNEVKEAYGRACEQPDGSWQITQANPDQPSSTVVEHTTIYPTYYGPWGPPWWGPPWWGAPFGFGAFGIAGFGDHHHHHRHRRW